MRRFPEEEDDDNGFDGGDPGFVCDPPPDDESGDEGWDNCDGGRPGVCGAEGAVAVAVAADEDGVVVAVEELGCCGSGDRSWGADDCFGTDANAVGDECFGGVVGGLGNSVVEAAAFASGIAVKLLLSILFVKTDSSNSLSGISDSFSSSNKILSSLKEAKAVSTDRKSVV